MSYQKISWILLFLFVFTACNKDDVIEQDTGQKPVITLDSETGVYLVKIGRTLTIAPTVEFAENATYSWIIDEKLVGTGSTFTTSFSEVGEVYVTFRVETTTGMSEEELRIDIAELAPPVISFALPSKGLKILPGTDYIFTPDIQNKEEGNFQMKWVRDGKTVTTDTAYTFNETKLGAYPITIEASNNDGETRKEIIVEVVETLPYTVSFEKLSYLQETPERNTFAGRSVYLIPSLEYFDHPQYRWFVDGQVIDGETGGMFQLIPQKAGDYTVKVEVTESQAKQMSLSRNITRGVTTVSGGIVVHAYGTTPESRQRPVTASSSKYQDKVYEYTPAPGQFVGEMKTAGFTGKEQTQEDAIAYATRRLIEGLGNPNSNNTYVSLGGFGGYIIVGFDHSVAKTSNVYDFGVQGNAFDGSSEAGIVWVMQDVNGNGLPDDEWYELKGSETGKEGTIQNYAITYYRPSGRGMDVQWTDSEGKKGCIDYLKAYHDQDYYYPAWVKGDSYTLRGTLLSARNMVDGSTGYWKNQAYDWGYVDNFGKDQLEGADTWTGSGQCNGFKISNAIQADGTPIDLKYIDFIKVQVGVNAKSGPLGEISTEVFGFMDLSVNK